MGTGQPHAPTVRPARRPARQGTLTLRKSESAAEATERVADYLRDSPVGGLLLGGLLGAYALLAIVAVVYDARVLYIRYPPEWVARCTQGRRAAQSPARFDGRILNRRSS